MITPSVKINKSYRKQIKCIKSVTKTTILVALFFYFILLIKRNIFCVALFILLIL